MPRAFTETEQASIRARLFEAGRDRFARLGLHKTTVGELARDAGIGKGTFYLFFPNKEALFFAIQEEEERAFKQSLLEEADETGRPVERVERLLLAGTQRLREHPILRQLTDPSVIASLVDRLSPAQLETHRRSDHDFFVKLARAWKSDGTLAEDVDPELVFDLIVAMFALSLERELIEEERFERVTRFMARTLATALAAD